MNEQQPLIATPSQTVGPYFRIGEAWLYHADLAGPGPAGPRRTVLGRVLDGDGKPVDDALLEIWQADVDGRYPATSRPPGWAGFGRIATDAGGAFSFTVVKPGRVPGPEGTLQAPHLALNVFMRGLLRHLVTRIYFPDEAEANAADPVLALVDPGRRATLVARPDPANPSALGWDVVLQGPHETVFFDCWGVTMPDRSSLLDPLFTTERLGVIASDVARVQGMLDFEAALARAEAGAGVVPAAAVGPIADACRSELYDIESLGEEGALAGNPAIPLVRALTARVAIAHPEASRWVHFGATSQDAIDTGLVLQLRQAIEILDDDLGRLAAALARLTRAHRETVLAGRTWLQQAEPITLGLKTAGWLAAADRHQARLREVRARALVVQLGGAVGNLAALGDRGPRVVDLLAEELELGVPELPWHTHRDRLAEVGTTLGLLTGTLGKIARDVALLMQTEVGEVFEPAAPGRGGSSSMPHKRNPVAAAVVGAAALRVPALVSTLLAAMVQEQERGLGGWHAEWEVLPEIWLLTGGALAQVASVAEGLEVDAARMAANLAASGGALQTGAVAAALTGRMGRTQAHALVERASRRAREEKRPLREALLQEGELRRHLSEAELDHLLEPRAAVASSAALANQLLARRRS